MLATLALATSLVAGDPRPTLVELQLAGKGREALARVETELGEEPEASRRLGLDYLRGHLLDRLGRSGEAGEAFVTAMGTTPRLALYSRYRLALEQERLNHPEVAAGLIASVVGGDPSSPLIPEAVRLLVRTLSRGGDCRLLRGIRTEGLQITQRRELLVAQADCAVISGMPEFARGLLVSLLEERRGDDPARGAAERLAGLVSEAERGRTPMLLGLTFHAHREFERALRHLKRSLVPGDVLSSADIFDTRYAIGRAHFWQERYAAAAVAFGELTHSAATPEQRARALYQQGRSYELLGEWQTAVKSFRLAYLAEPLGTEWAAASLFSALRLEWRSGDETSALPTLELLSAQPGWRDQAARAALFLAASDVVRGRADRARPWLDRATAFGSRDDQLEAAYWRGRLAELEKDWPGAAAAYLDAARNDLFHPLARAGVARLTRENTAEPLARAAAVEGRRLASSLRPEDLYGAWILLGLDNAAGRQAHRKLQEILLADRSASPFVRFSEIPVRRWPLWDKELTGPEEMLLALGVMPEGAPAVGRHFPVSDPSLAYTGSILLSRGGEHERSILRAEALRIRTPERLPLALQPRDFHRLLYPHPYRELIEAQARQRGFDPELLTAIIREESRLDPYALSPAAARGLTQFTLPTARRLAAQIDLQRLEPDDLYRPEISIALGAVYVVQLLEEFGGAPYPAVAAYNAGEPQAKVWRSYCNSPEPEEFFTKVGFKETRAYLRRVLTSEAHYEELY
jgi:soluble lytic murein transglycosylase